FRCRAPVAADDGAIAPLFGTRLGHWTGALPLRRGTHFAVVALEESLCGRHWCACHAGALGGKFLLLRDRHAGQSRLLCGSAVGAVLPDGAKPALVNGARA